MDHRSICLCVSGLLLAAQFACAEPTNIAEDDAAHSGYSGSWGNDKNGGSGFAAWITTSEGTGADQHAGFFIAETSSNSDLNGIAKDGKAFGLFANGAGFEQAVAFRAFNKPLETGDSFSFMIETGGFEKKSDKRPRVAARSGSCFAAAPRAHRRLITMPAPCSSSVTTRARRTTRSMTARRTATQVSRLPTPE
jgi:hypothetical protein